MELVKIIDPKDTADSDLVELEKIVIEMLKDEESVEIIKKEIVKYVEK